MEDYDDWLASQAEEDEQEAQRRKDEVGMAEPGSDRYYRNARYILESYGNPNSDTKAKLAWLRENGY